MQSEAVSGSCTGVAARIAGTLVAEALAPGATKRETIRIGMPSGILAVGAAVERPQRLDRAARLVLPHYTPDVCWTALSSTVMKRS